MNTAAKTPIFNRLPIDIFSFKWLARLQRATSPGEFYQQIASELIKGIYTKQALTDVGNKLIALADHANAVLQVNAIEHVSQLLLSLPLPHQYEKVGRYYYALSLKRRGRIAEARTLLEQVAEDAPLRFRARATLIIGATYYESGDFSSALPFYIEANRAAAYDNWCDPLTSVQTARMIAVLKSIDGNHRGASADLRRLLPLARMVGTVYPHDYSIHLNSLAVESMEIGELEEARHICRIILASPFADVYPEYRETWDDIQIRGYRTSRSVLSLNHSALNIGNVLPLILPERNLDAGWEKPHRSPFQQQASVTSLQDWKQKMGKEPNGDKKNNQEEELSDRQMVMKIMEYATELDLPDDVLRQMLDAVKKIAEDYRKKKS